MEFWLSIKLLFFLSPNLAIDVLHNKIGALPYLFVDQSNIDTHDANEDEYDSKEHQNQAHDGAESRERHSFKQPRDN